MRLLALIIPLAISFAAVADTVQIRDDAPDRHVVVKGDTLWDISAKFLKTPWLWPELWQINKDQIKNPHLIYPGDVILMTMTAGGPRFSKMETVKLYPSMHSEPIPREEAITTIPYGVVEAFLHRPLVADMETMGKAPRLIASEDGRVMITTGDRVYAAGVGEDAKAWHIVREGKYLKDPETDAVIAREVEYVGDAETAVPGRPTTLVVRHVEKEVLVGDRIIPATDAGTVDFLPRAPARATEGRIISAYGGTQAAARYSTVVINKGSADGVEIGHVLAVYRQGRYVGKVPGKGRFSNFSPRSGFINSTEEREGRVEYNSLGEEFADFIDPFDFFFKPFPDGRRGWRYLDYKCLKPGVQVAGESTYDPGPATMDCPDGQDADAAKWAYLDIGCLKPGKRINFGESFDPRDVYEPHCRPMSIKLPDVRTGLVMVYRVFSGVSYALVMESSGPIYLLDSVRNP